MEEEEEVMEIRGEFRRALIVCTREFTAAKAISAAGVYGGERGCDFVENNGFSLCGLG